MTWNEIPPEHLADNPIQLIAEDWTLITGGTLEKWNTMTASWGGLGVIWKRPVTFIFVRPTRYTYHFLEQRVWHTLSFFDEEHRSKLTHCGNVSGRDHDKAAETGLVPEAIAHEAVTFAQARLVILSRTIYFQDLDAEGFVDPSISANYPKKDYHRLYVGEIEKVLVRQ